VTVQKYEIPNVVVTRDSSEAGNTILYKPTLELADERESFQNVFG